MDGEMEALGEEGLHHQAHLVLGRMLDRRFGFDGEPFVEGPIGQVQCASLSSVIDPVEFTVTGGTTLKYDTPSNQFHQNWQTPKQPGACLRVEVVFAGGLQRLSATFQLK